MLAQFIKSAPRSMSAFRYAMALLLLGTLVFTSGTGQAEQHKKNALPKFYGDWLNHDVPYIINKQERKEFLQLTTDEERDKFISRFWEVRNPTPGASVNTYKDDIYQRIAYADAHFGIGS